MKAPPNFNRLSRLYRWLEYASFGPWLWWCRCAFLGDLRDRRNALVLGDGDGRFTARLLQSNPVMRVDAVDASAAMLRALAHRVGANAVRLRTVCTDARAWQPDADAHYDLVVTHFFLDCLTTRETMALAARLRGVAADDAQWVISEFAIPSGRARSLLARAIIGGLYRAFGWMTGLAVRKLPDHASALRAARFTQQKRRDWLGGLLTSQLWTVGWSNPPGGVYHRSSWSGPVHAVEPPHKLE